MTSALEGLRVLDISHGPTTGLATMILADFGAQVLTVQRPQDDPLARLPGAPLWQRGKHMIDLDLSRGDDMHTLHRLCDAADVLVCNWRTSALQRAGLDYATLHSQHPHLIYAHVTGFGHTGPWADLPAYEHLVAAASGRMLAFQGIVERRGPIFSALQVGIHATAQSLLTGILAALLTRHSGAAGTYVTTSLLQGMLPYEQGSMIGSQFPQRFDLPPLSEEPPQLSLYYHPAQTSDGEWLQFGNLLPHLFDNFLLVTDLADILADPDFDGKQLLFDNEKQEQFRERMLLRIQSRTADEWLADCIANGGVVATRYQTTQQALQDADIVANGHAVPRADGGVQLGVLARLTQTPGSAAEACQSGEALLREWLAQAALRTPSAASTDDPAGSLPLAGIKVVELATIIAAPLGASFLADLGADVIKVEQLGGDPYRGLLGGIGSARVNAGKRSISVDLKSAAGREVVMRLLQDADVVIHNYRPGVPERLGIDYASVQAANPDVVYLQCNGYGPDGPGALRPSTHPIPGAAMGGVYYQMAEQVPPDLQDMQPLLDWTRRMMRANEVNPDPNTALVVASSALLGLVARQRTGHGQQIYVDMFGANAYANHDDFLSYPGKADRLMPDPMLHGLGATYRLYPCQDGEWIFLALVHDHERRRFVAGISSALPGLLAEDTQLADDAATLELLSELFSQQPAQAWEDLAVEHSLGCVRADAFTPVEFWLQHPQAQALGLTQPQTHPQWGAYRRHGSNVSVGEANNTLGPPPVAGQHTFEILTAYGYSNTAIEQLLNDRVLWIEAAD